MPFDNRIFHFREDEFRQLFPTRIVDWMIAHSEPDKDDGAYRELPEARHLPVVVAIRMSLSFPLLLSAVPLHARDHTLAGETEKQKFRRCWFSDGGICSNFPIHFFDNLWPGWPTFGITLEGLRTGQTDRVFLPTRAGQGILRNFRSVDSLGGFLGSILDTMQEWRDNLQSVLPGFRDRIVHIALDEHEGGMNLNMPSNVVEALAAYGRAAGERICQEFDWPTHRWVRFLVSMNKLQSTLASMKQRYDAGAPGDAESDVQALMACAERWKQFAADAIPKPDVDLRITPKP
jgi:predicted acylesterase/phospholipase RssA